MTLAFRVLCQGNEGVQVKEGTVGTLIENNEIYMQLDDDSGGTVLITTTAVDGVKTTRKSTACTTSSTNMTSFLPVK